MIGIGSIRAEVSDELLRELKDESERYLGIDPHRSLRISEVLIDLAEVAGQPNHQAFGCLAKADALRSLARYDESRALFIRAGDSFLAQNNPVGWARTRTGLLLVSQFLGRSAEVLADVGKAQAILIGHGEWLRAAGLSQNAGLAESDLGRYDEALARFDDALAMYERATSAGQLGAAAAEIRSAKSRGNQALVLTRRGDFRAALTLLEAARAVFARHGETVLVHSQDTFIADVHAALGNYSQALQLYGQAFAGFGQADLAVDVAFVALKRVECYLRLNLNAVALDLSRDAIALFEQVNAPAELAKARVYRALALARLGQHQAALNLLDLAARTFEEIDALGYLGLTLLQRADVRLGEQDWPAAEADAQRARQILLDRGMVVPAARAGLTLAAGWLRDNRLDRAEGQIADSLAVARERDLSWLAQEGHHLRGRVARARADDQTALAEYRASIASIERVQGGLANELQIHFLGDKLEVYHEIVDLCLGQRQITDAFGYLERAKSRALVDYLARHPDVRLRLGGVANPGLAERLSRLREEHHWCYHRLHGNELVANPADPTAAVAASAEIASLQQAVREREKQIGEILEQQALERGHPDDGTRASFHGEVRSVPPALPTGTVLLEYYCAGERFGVFVWADARLTFVPLTARPAELRRLLNAWSLNLNATARAVAAGSPLTALAQNAEKILSALARALLGDIHKFLQKRERLIIIPHGLTHLMPFGALVYGKGPLIESMDLSVSPSTSVLRLAAAHRVRDRTRALVVGNSDGGRLPGAVAEAETIAAILPGACYLEGHATRAAFVREAPNYGVIHLAAHGESRLDNPTFAHLKLADGLLGPVDVFNLDLDGALVTLSGCETGQSIVAGGDELVGLSRGFLYAGAATLVHSLWRVEDRSTSKLMETFYRALGSGRPAGSALREAQLTLRAERGEHPFFWAPFQVVGDPGYLDSPPTD